MIMGYNGKVLFVDLTSGCLKEENLPEKIYRNFIGGTGLGVRVLYERMKAKVDPLGPENLLGFLTGPLTGLIPGSSRFQVVGKSPITGGWGDSSGGGSFAPELKAAGYDAVFFSGISPKPVYIFLHDSRAELKDASHLWGKDTVETQESLQKELRDKRVKVACIGPAGEAKSLTAAIMHEIDAAARSGLAAVMGAKRLKAVAVRGTKKVPVADIEQCSALRRNFLKDVKKMKHECTDMLKTWGTPAWVSPMVCTGEGQIKNWTLLGEEAFPTHSKLNADEVTKYQVRKHACLTCPLGCHGIVRQDKGPYAVGETAKPEYETLQMFGGNCLNDNVESIIKITDICNRYGLDTISVGSTIAFAMECYERGVIGKEDMGGIELTWGNAAAIIDLVGKISRREGFGAMLADGSKIAAEHIGKGSEKWAMHSGGQDLPAHDPRVTVAYGWGYVCDPTPGRHTVSENTMVSWEGGLPYSPYAELQFPKTDVLDYEANAPIYATFSDFHLFNVSTGVCYFLEWPGTLPLVESLSAVTGWDFTITEGLKVGRRIQTLRQAFNIREGLHPSEWRLPERLEAVSSTGPTAGRKVDFKTMKEKGYAALGWDAATGKPLESTLQELGLKELIRIYLP